jgi:formylglycine-generating enzyme required for sulfatase activity
LPADFSAEAGRMAQLRPFELDQAEVTNREFAEFANATGYATQAERADGLFDYTSDTPVFRPRESWKTLRDALAAQHLDPSDYAVRGIDFEAAQAFCKWRHRRLPTGDEWEFVARGADRHVFPWGNEALHESRAGVLLPVTEQLRTGRFGNRGLGGALWEWVDEGSAHQPALRGASWRDSNVVDQRLAAQRFEDPTRAYVDSGARCARFSESWPDQ